MIIDIGPSVLPIVNISFLSPPTIDVTLLPPSSSIHILTTPGPVGPEGAQGPPGPPSDQIVVSDTPPSSPEINDLWVDTT